MILERIHTTAFFVDIVVGGKFKTHDGQSWIKITKQEAVCEHLGRQVLFAGPELPPVRVLPMLPD
jgi:hypothetical protein